MADQKPAPKRTPIPRKLRFEVLKRDSFKCQYCGASAPEVLLHIDHIEPVSKGGATEITNLITSCAQCNLGKGDRRLDDNAAIQKSRDQLEELQERREQLEMMMEWRRGLRELADDTVDQVCQYWYERAPGWTLSPTGQAEVKRWLKRFSVEEVVAAMDTAADQYLEFDADGAATQESWDHAFDKIGGICRVTRMSRENPDLKELYYIRGILRKRLGYFDDARGMQMLKAAHSWEVSVNELREMALSVRSWTQFRESIDEMIDRQERLLVRQDSVDESEGGEASESTPGP